MTPAFFFVVRIYNIFYNFIAWLIGEQPKEHNITYHVLSDDYDVEDLADMDRVPEDTIYIEEWERNGRKRCILFYESDQIMRGIIDPFEEEPHVPWIWIGDKKTEVDLTSAMQKYMAVSNVIELALLLHLIQVHHDTELMYVDARTLEEVKFPASGVRITAANGNKNTVAA